MGSTYETDDIERREEIELALQAAIAIKSLSNLIGCRSWLVARLAMKEINSCVAHLVEMVNQGSKDKEGKT